MRVRARVVFLLYISWLVAFSFPFYFPNLFPRLFCLHGHGEMFFGFTFVAFLFDYLAVKVCVFSGFISFFILLLVGEWTPGKLGDGVRYNRNWHIVI